MSYIDDIKEIDDIFYNLEEDQIKQEKPKEKPKTNTIKPLKRNSLGLTEKEAEIVGVILFGGLFVIFLTSILIGYMLYYFALPY
jgi:hypothetical protein